MDRTLLLASENGKTCAALIEDGRLVQFIRDADRPAPGSVYLGRVQRVLEGLGGAFVDIGLGKNGLISGHNDLPKAERDIDGTLFVGLRTAANLRYRDVVLAVEQRLTSPLFYRCDTVRYLLTDDEGFALSPGVNHHQYESQHVPFHLQKGQSGSVRIRHLMRHEVIPDITELGIRIDE